MTTTPPTGAGGREFWPLERLIPYARNARTHSEKQISQIAASITEFGWTNPILVAEDGTVIAGHGRLEAARMLGLESAPVLIAKGWSEQRRRAYTLVDNRLAENAGWDRELLAIELADLQSADFDVALTGFDDRELRNFGLEAPPETPAKPFEYQEKFAVLVECQGESDQRETYERLTADGLTCRILVN